MATLKGAYAASLVVSMLAVITTCSSFTSPASSAAVSSSGTLAESPAVSAATSTLDKIKAIGVLRVGVRVGVPDFGLENTRIGEVEGFEIDLAKTITKDLLDDESKVETQTVTAKTRGPLLDNGEINLVIATFTITDECRRVYNFSDPYYSDAVKLMVREDSGIKSLKDLNGKTIDTAQSSTSIKVIQGTADAADVRVRFDEYAIYLKIKAALDLGRMRCFSVDGSIPGGHVNDTTATLDDKCSSQECGIASKLDNKDLVEYVNGMVAQLKSSGGLDQMITKRELN